MSDWWEHQKGFGRCPNLSECQCIATAEKIVMMYGGNRDGIKEFEQRCCYGDNRTDCPQYIVLNKKHQTTEIEDYDC